MLATASEINGLLQAGQLARQQGQLTEARKCLGAALAEARRNGSRPEEVTALLELARLSENTRPSFWRRLKQLFKPD